MTIDDICNNSEFVAPQEPIDPNSTSIIKVIGVGGGGGNAVGYMYQKGVKDVKFVVCNTDKQALRKLPIPDQVLLGHTGLGAGDKPEVAREAAEESIEAINALFDKNTKMVFITAGMGGGTGTGAAPIVARAAKEHGVLTIGIVTIPFFFEGVKKITKALQGADEIRKYVDALLLINNEKLIDIYHDLDFDSAFSKADDSLDIATRSIADLITNDEVRINIDFNDVDTTLRNGGSAIISCGYGEGEDRVQRAINEALNSPLLSDNDILTSRRLLFNMAYSRTAEKPFKLGEMTSFTEFVNGIKDVEVIYGVSYDETLGDKVKVTILASGFDTKTLIPGELNTASDGHKHAPEAEIEQRIETMYNVDMKKQHHVVLQPEEMDSDDIIERLEASPTAKRTKEEKSKITRRLAATAPNAPAANTPTSGNQIVF